MRNKCTVFLLALVLICSGVLVVSAQGTYNAAAFGAELDAAAQAYGDENFDYYAYYFTPQEYKLLYDNIQGSFGGIGIYMRTDYELGYCLVVGVIEGTPAEAAGLAYGDLIVSINGEDVHDKDSDYVVARVRGEKGTTVNLGIRHANGNEEELTLKRAEIPINSVYDSWLDEQKGIAYIAVTAFNQETFKEFSQAFNDMASERYIKCLILDLRNNGGGSLDAGITLCSAFIESGKPVIKMQTKTNSFDYTSGGGGTNVPLVCLQNGNTASASEIFLSCIKDYKRAVIVGEQSFGKGIAQSIELLNSGYGLRYTYASYLSPLGNKVHKIGIEPDILVKAEEGFYADSLNPDPDNDIQLLTAYNEALKLAK